MKIWQSNSQSQWPHRVWPNWWCLHSDSTRQPDLTRMSPWSHSTFHGLKPLNHLYLGLQAWFKGYYTEIFDNYMVNWLAIRLIARMPSAYSSNCKATTILSSYTGKSLSNSFVFCTFSTHFPCNKPTLHVIRCYPCHPCSLCHTMTWPYSMYHSPVCMCKWRVHSRHCSMWWHSKLPRWERRGSCHVRRWVHGAC